MLFMNILHCFLILLQIHKILFNELLHITSHTLITQTVYKKMFVHKT